MTLGAGLALVAATLAGCGSPGTMAPPPAATSASTPTTGGTAAAAPATPCPSSPPAAATTDFPHPALTKAPPPTTSDPEADALAARGLAGLQALGGPVSTGAFRHYLAATGTYLTLPVDDLLDADPAFAAELTTRLTMTAADAVTRATTVAPCTAVAFDSGWLPHDDVADHDWVYTLGRFWFCVQGTATREDVDTDVVTVDYAVVVGDTYDFDGDSPFAEFGDLAAEGRAAVFLDGGVSTARSVTVTAPAGLATAAF